MKVCPYDLQKGFTIVEVLVALFIIALVILGGGLFFFYGRVNIIREAHRRAAVLVASQRLEELKGAEFGEISGPEDEYYIKWSETDGWSFVTSIDAPEPVDVDNLSAGSSTGPTI
jgi:prepilin-type N-terminal cleavage/methylation domain-containing protein